MNPSHDLFILMFTLSQMRDKGKIMELFQESISELFKPVQFIYSEQKKINSTYSEEISTRNYSYGYISSTNVPNQESKSLLQNAIQMLAVILDRLKFENELKNRADSLETITKKQFIKITSYVEELEVAKLASLNLIEDLKEEIEERKKAEENLLKSQERFDFAMKASTDGLFDWNLETNDIYYAPAWKKMLGYEDHELPNDFSVWETTTNPEDVKKSWELQQKLISKQIDRFVMEFKMKHKDGHWVDILSRAGAIFDESGKVIRIVGTHTDITERKKADEKLEKQNEYVKMILDNFPIGIAANEIDSMKVTYMNRKFSEIYGWPEDEFPYIGNFFEKVFPDIEYRQQMQTRILEDMSSGDMERMNWDNLKIATKAGEQRIVHAFNIPLLNQNIMVSTVQDVTERKKAELTLRESEGKFRTLVENIPQKVFMKDMDYKWIFVNKNLADDLEITPEEVLGKIDTDFFPPELAAKYHADDERIISSGQTEEMEEKYIEKGEDRWINTVKTAIKDENNKVIGLLGLSWDITDRKRSEDEISKQMDELRRWYEVTLDREGRILELKKEVNELLKQRSEPLRYESAIPDDSDVE